MKKKIHIELLRIMAIYFVMFNHTQNNGFLYFADNTESPLYYFYMFVSILCKVAVPIFFMITGALLLKKEESIKNLLFKRFFKFASILLVMSLVYYIVLYDDFSIGDFIERVYSSDVTTGLWYLYSYLGILLMMPILRKLVVNLTDKEFKYIFICRIILFGLIPLSEYLIWKGKITLNDSFSAVLFTADNIFYVLFGYYCENVIDIRGITKKSLSFLGIASFLCIAVTCFVTNFRLGVIGTIDKNSLTLFFTSLICIPCFALYLLFKKISLKAIPKKLEGIIIALGSSVFGAYLLEKLIRIVTCYVYGGVYKIIGPFWASIIWVAVGMSAGLIFVALIKKIPVVGKFLARFI